MGKEFFKRPIRAKNASDPDLFVGTVRRTVTATTAASTSLGPRGSFAIATTSTGAAGFVFDIGTDYKAGDELSIMIDSSPSATTPAAHVNFGAATVAASSADMCVLTTVGAAVSLVAISTSRWLITGNQGATFSTST